MAARLAMHGMPILAAALAFLPCAAAPASEPADSIRYPYVAGLSRVSGAERVYFCSGTLIAPQWILTAAHCFHSPSGVRIAGGARIAGSASADGIARVTGETLEAGDLWAAVGRDSLKAVEDNAQMRIERVVIHPDYDRQTQTNDIALVRLDQIAGPLIAEAGGGPEDDPPAATALGFGSLYEGMIAANALTSSGSPASQSASRLRRARLRLVFPAECIGPGTPAADPDYTVCAAAAPEEACVSDSGGPLIAETAEGPDRLLGVLTYGTGCAVAEPHVAYTRVAPYVSWIEETIAE